VSRAPRGRASLDVLAALGLVALVVAVFRPVLDAGFVNWDDDLIVTGNARYRGLDLGHLRWMATSLHGGHWEPLTWLSLAVDHALWGMDPRGYHATALALHAVNAVLVFALARALFPALRTAGAAAAAALFAVHPLRVESVAWVSERRDVLSASLFLLATLLWVRHARRGGGAFASGALIASVAAFALALAAKASGLAFPLIFLALDVWPTGRLRALGRRRVLLEKVPYLVLSVAVLFPAVAALERFGATEMGGALAPAQRAAQVAYGAFFYASRTLLPIGLSPLYLLDLDLEPLSARFLVPALAVVAVSAALFALRRRWPAALLAWGAYLALIAPFLGVQSNGIHLVADRYAYVATLPFALLAGAGIARLAALPAGLATALLVGALGGLARVQVRVWHDSRALWDRVLALEPDNYVACVKRAAVRRADGDRDGALADLARAIAVRPQYAVAYANRGAMRAPVDPEGALADLDRALELRPGEPNALASRGALRIRLGDHAGALADLDAALRARPGDPGMLLNRGLAHLGAGDRAAALADLAAALAAAPTDWPYRALAERKASEARAGK
jgi:tetratricopeptide (TPR) repeat protein